MIRMPDSLERGGVADSVDSGDELKTMTIFISLRF